MVILCQVSWGTALIRVLEQPEPPQFDEAVRVPGNAFLRALRRAPTRQDWNANQHWRKCLSDLQSAYGDVCAFTACWLSYSASVDHFLPKGDNPQLAYEWSNYRLASQKVNTKKGNNVVLDPFKVDDTWFVLDFGSSRVRPSKRGSVTNQALIQRTIDILGLNDPGWIKVRFTVLRQYANLKISFAHLQDLYPFIARELDRQALRKTIIGTMP